MWQLLLQMALLILVSAGMQAGWLVLQAPRWVFQEGEPIHLRCHSWKNTSVHSVTYLQNGKGRRFFHHNSDYHIPKATPGYNGSYFCRGLVGKKNVSSETVNIIVQGSTSLSVSPSFLPWHQVAFCLVMVLLFAVDTGLYFSMQRKLRSSPRDWKDHKFKWSQDPQDK
uniref:Immunoglobulin domain-containing protein n=1 Tax=Propithecus coquereli TaxID=379532 RepID=A0A2K6FFV7_PROCO